MRRGEAKGVLSGSSGVLEQLQAADAGTLGACLFQPIKALMMERPDGFAIGRRARRQASIFAASNRHLTSTR
jgi:hypothetical protein